jgi:RimJ/RimL family protein N-acetyltransferase
MQGFSLSTKTDRLVLRPFQRGDVAAVARYHTLPSVQRYVVRPTRYPEEVASAVDIMCGHTALQRPGDTISAALVRQVEGDLIGQVSLLWSDATAGQGEVRFVINPLHAGNGYLSEALSSVFDVAFGHFRIHRLFVKCEGRNHHTAKLMQKLGMRLEAHYREHALFQGEWDEELHFAILDREWQASSKVRPLPLQGRVA